MVDYTVCITDEDVIAAIDVLLNAEYILLDCEGRDLGNAGGALSLIQLGTPGAEKIFLIDVLVVPHHSLQRLFNKVLACEKPRKVLWDGRMDDAELYFGYSCALKGVLDLQLVDILSRSLRGENNDRRISRMARSVFPMKELRKLQLEGVHGLGSMDGAAREHGVAGMPPKDANVKKIHADNDTEAWMMRPLSSILVAYAATDIVRIAALYKCFEGHGYLVNEEHLYALSTRYVSLHRTEGRPDPVDMFRRGPYLPLCMMPLAASKGNPRTLNLKQCTKCTRFMAEEHFPLPRRRKSIGDTSMNVSRGESCKICVLIEAKLQYAKKRDDERVQIHEMTSHLQATQIQ